MRTLATIVLLFALASPAAAAWRQNGGTSTWYVVHPTALMTELREALLWHYEGQALDGALATAARPQIALTDVGGGNSELAITMATTPGTAWVADYAARACPSASTQATRAACVDLAIKSDLSRHLHAYRLHLRDQLTPIEQVPEL